MDRKRFDELACRLAVSAPRRRVVAALVGVLGGGGVARAVAAGFGQRRGVCRPAGVGCSRNAQCCSAECATSRSLPRNRRNRCACIPACEGRVCGNDGCGGVCGACADGDGCSGGACLPREDCSGYEGALDPDYITWCLTTTEGTPALSLNCLRTSGTPCTSSTDCADVVGRPGDVAVCATSYTMCMLLGACRAPMLYPRHICVAINAVGCAT